METITNETLKLWYTPRLDPPVPSHWKLSEDLREALEDFLWERHLVLGDSDLKNYLETIEETLGDSEYIYVLEDYSEEILNYIRALVESRRAYAQKLGLTSGAGNITRAFKALKDKGVVAREAYCFSSNDGVVRISEERDDSRTWYGFVFFTQQDAEQIPRGGFVYLDFGVFGSPYFTQEEWEDLPGNPDLIAKYEDLAVQLMKERVVPVLERYGMQVHWDGQYSKRPLISNVQYIAVPE